MHRTSSLVAIMGQSQLAVCVLGLIACFCFHVSDASLCKPNSKFKYDCNSCSCSSTGREFSCTNIICAPIAYKDKYLIEQNEKGHTILIPKLKRLAEEPRPKDDGEFFINDRPIGGKFKRSFIKTTSYRKRPLGNFVEQSDYSDYGDDIPANFDDEDDTSRDYDDSNENSYEDGNPEDVYADEELDTFGKLSKNRL